MRRYRYNQKPKTRKRNLIIFISVLTVFALFFVRGPNGLVKIIGKHYKTQKLQREIEHLKIKAELLESKIAKGKDPEYLRKYMIDNYNMVPKDSVQ